MHSHTPRCCLFSCPGLKVWAFDPPGGLCDPRLSHALAATTVAVMLGKDGVPRTSAGMVGGLVQEGLVGVVAFLVGMQYD